MMTRPACRLGRRVDFPKVAGVVGDQDEIVFGGMACDVPIFPAGFADPGDVLSVMAGGVGDRDQIGGEALIDQKPHPASIAASLRRMRRTGAPRCQGCARGRPRAG